MTTDRSRPQAIGLVAGLCLLSIAAAAYEIAPASVIPLVRDSLGVGPTGAGALVSVMYATAVVVSLPAGMLLDRVSPRRGVLAAGLLLLLAGGWGWVAAMGGAYLSLIASRIVGGVAYVIVWNAGANLVGGVVDPEYRATAVGIFTASAPVGFVLGQFGSPLVAGVAGWPAALPGFASLGAVGLLVFLVATRGQDLGVDAGSPDREAVGVLFRDRTVWKLSTLCFLGFSLYLFLNTWLPSYLADGLGLSLAASGLLTAVFPAVGIVARSASGAVSDRLFGGRRRPVILGAFIVAAPAVVGFVWAGGLPSVIALLLVAGIAVQLTIGLLFTYIAEVVDPTVRATAIALMTSVGLFGAFAAPLAAGVLIEWAGYRPAFLAAGAVAVVGVVLAWRTPEASRHGTES